MDEARPAREVELHLAFDLLSVTLARQQLAQHLLDHGCDEQQVRNAATVLSELLMNAVVHGGPDDRGRVRAAWRLDDDGAVTLRVRDHGAAGVPQLQDPDATDGGGRGIRLIDRLSREWGYEVSEGLEVTAVVTP